MTSQSSESGLPAYILLEHVKTADEGEEENPYRTTIIDNGSNGLFGEWLDGKQVLDLLKSSEELSKDSNVGKPKTFPFKLASQSHAALTTFWDVNAKKLVSPHEMPLEIFNSTRQCHIRIRWLDEDGKFYPWLYQWNIPPSSTYEQYTKPGHLFLISMIDRTASDEEIILAAYRTKRALPSLSPHCIYIYDDDHGYNNGGLCLEMMLLADESKVDALSVAVSDLDHHHETIQDRIRIQKVVTLLQTIISNLLKNPDEEKFQQLRMGNSKIKSLTNEWGAMEILNLIGFTKQRRRRKSNKKENSDDDDDSIMMEEEYLILSKGRMLVSVCQSALDVLEILAHRLEPNFIPDLAPPTPWQEVSVSSTGSGGGGGLLLSNWNNDGTRGFLTEDERWARAERLVGLRSSGRARRPNPGEAPSSRGKWGR